MAALMLYLLESRLFLKKTEQYSTILNILNSPTSYVPIFYHLFHVSSFIFSPFCFCYKYHLIIQMETFLEGYNTGSVFRCQNTD